MEPHRIGIPPTLMRGEKGQRIPIEHWGDGLLVFNKPSVLAAKSDPWFLDSVDLESAFNEQIPTGKPELEHHGITELRTFNPLERGASGAVLASTTPESAEHWRNAYGSFQFQFHHILITRKSERKASFECRLPLMRHFKQQRMQVSHQLGKKACTHFAPLGEGSTADAWLASTRYPRLHQLRLHARESGIPMLRDPLYDPSYPPEMLSSEPYRFEWMHAHRVDACPSLGLDRTSVFLPPPKYWKRTLRRIGLEIDELITKSEEIIKNITLPIE